MERTLINSTFSIFGNFTSIIRDEAKLKEVFKDYAQNQSKEQLPNGVPSNVFSFGIKAEKQISKAIVIKASRIDVNCGYLAGENHDQFLKTVEELFGLH